MDTEHLAMKTFWNVCCLCVVIYGFHISANTCIYHETMGEFWKRDFCLERKNLTGMLSVSTSTSLLHCAEICSMGICVIFTYNTTTGRCLGFSSFGTANQSPVHAVRPEIYRRDDELRVCDMQLTVYGYRTTFAKALATCNLNCGRLLVLDTIEKQDCFFDNQDIKGGYWIGLTDVDKEGKWLWVNGIPLVRSSKTTTGFNNYDVAMEDNIMRTNADCGVSATEERLIHDMNCENKVKFICEKP